MEIAEGEGQRSAERMRYLFCTIMIGVTPLALLAAGRLGALIPVASDWLEAAIDSLGFVSFIALLPAQFVVVHRAGNSMHLRDSDRLLVGTFCALFSVAPVVAAFALMAWANS